MSQPFVGEIRMFGGNFAPLGWAFCNGAILAISQNEVLFNLIGTTFGGDGQQTFSLPDLRGRVPIHQGQGPGLSSHTLGEQAGTESVTLTTNQLPAHSHPVRASLMTGAAAVSPAANYWSRDPGGTIAPYRTTSDVSMNAGALASAGSSQPHENVQPFLAVSFIIAMEGIFPSQN